MKGVSYWVKVVTYAAVIFLCQKRCALGKCITCVTFFNNKLVDYDGICLAHFAGHTGSGAWHIRNILEWWACWLWWHLFGALCRAHWLRCMTCTHHSWMMSLLIMMASVWRTLRGTLASVHDIYATFLNDAPVDYDSICLIMRGQ